MIFKSDGNQENTLFDIKITALSEKEWSINPSESILTYQSTSLFYTFFKVHFIVVETFFLQKI